MERGTYLEIFGHRIYGWKGTLSFIAIIYALMFFCMAFVMAVIE